MYGAMARANDRSKYRFIDANEARSRKNLIEARVRTIVAFHD